MLVVTCIHGMGRNMQWASLRGYYIIVCVRDEQISEKLVNGRIFFIWFLP